MEEKERYEIQEIENIIDLNDTEFAIIDNVKNGVISFDKICDLLNQQDKRIKELEQENRDLEDDHNKLIDQYDKQYNDLCKEIQFHSSARERFVKKVKELKQQLADKDYKIEVLKKALEFLAEEFIYYEQSLIEECMIEGGVLTDSGYEIAKKFLIDKSKLKAKEMLGNELKGKVEDVKD